jgi:hypothetical protein
MSEMNHTLLYLLGNTIVHHTHLDRVAARLAPVSKAARLDHLISLATHKTARSPRTSHQIQARHTPTPT